MAKKMAPKPPTPAQLKALKDSKGVKPTAAFTKTGQKATGLAPRTPAPDGKRTPIRTNISGLSMRGSGTPLGTSMGINPLNKGQIANAALTAVALPGSGQVRNYLGAKAGTRVTEAAFKASTKGFEASGAGGKVKNVMTPFGRTLGSTSIGSAGQQSARMGNLEIAKAKEAARAGRDIAGQVVRGMNKAGKTVKGVVIGGVVGKGVANKAKKK